MLISNSVSKEYHEDSARYAVRTGAYRAKTTYAIVVIKVKVFAFKAGSTRIQKM
jgi:hypothetical protein